MSTEPQALQTFLDAQRKHVLDIVEGLDDEELRVSVLPSGWSSLGLIRHLTWDVEQFWFNEVMSGLPRDPAAGDESPWVVPDGRSAESILDDYRTSIVRTDEYLAATPLDRPPAFWPEELGFQGFADLQDVLLHVMTETACHAGHLDSARELIDGRLWKVVG